MLEIPTATDTAPNNSIFHSPPRVIPLLSEGGRFKRFGDKISHCHIKDVSAELAEAVRGGETGIACSVVAIGEGVNAENIAGCIELLKDADWDGVLSIECEAAPGKVEQSLEWLRKEIAR